MPYVLIFGDIVFLRRAEPRLPRLSEFPPFVVVEEMGEGLEMDDNGDLFVEIPAVVDAEGTIEPVRSLKI